MFETGALNGFGVRVGQGPYQDFAANERLRESKES